MHVVIRDPIHNLFHTSLTLPEGVLVHETKTDILPAQQTTRPPSILLKNKSNLIFTLPPPPCFVYSFALSGLIPRLMSGKVQQQHSSSSGIFSLHPSLTGEKKKMEAQWPDPTGVPSEHHPHVPAGKHSQLSASAQPLLWLMLDLEALLHMGCKCIIPLPYK